MKKIVSATLSVLVISMCAAAVAFGADNRLKIRAGADSSSFSYQFRVAEGAGIFDKYGLDVDVFTFSYGIDTINAALLGETDTAQAADFAVASRLSEGNNLRILAHILTYRTDGNHLYTRDPGVKTAKDLKGKKIGVQKATVIEYVWGQLFEKQGIDPKDVEQVYLSSNAELLTAFQAGEIDALWVSGEYEAAAKQVENSHELGNYELTGFTPRAYLLVDKDFIDKNKDGVINYLKALDEATTFLKERPDEAAEIIAKDLKIPADSARQGITTYNYEVRFLQEDLEDVADVAAWSIKTGLIKNAAYDVNNSIVLGPIKEAFPDRVTVK